MLQDLGDYEEAAQLLRLALDSDQKNFEPGHPRIAVIQSNLALVLKDLGDYVWARDDVNVGTLSDYGSADDASSDIDGYENTRKIRAAGTSTKFPAAYSVNFSSGWYLPACGQLYELVNNITTVNSSLSTLSQSGVTARTLNTSSACWWSSTEFGSSRAWFVKYNGLRYNGLKSVDLTVRAVCDF